MWQQGTQTQVVKTCKNVIDVHFEQVPEGRWFDERDPSLDSEKCTKVLEKKKKTYRTCAWAREEEEWNLIEFVRLHSTEPQS